MNSFNKNFFLREALGGFTTFLTMSYIIMVNPQIVSSAGSGISSAAALNATVCVSILMTLLAGLFIRLPYAIAPGMGLNSFVVFTVIIGKHIPWQTAMGITFLTSILFLGVSLTPLRRIIIEALPENFKHATICGIGFLLAYIGLRNLGLIVSSPVTYVKLGEFNSSVFLGLFGFLVVFYFSHHKKAYAFLVSIFLVTLLAFCLDKIPLPQQWFAAPDFSTFFQLDIPSAFKASFISIVITLLLTSIFDCTATLMAVAQHGNFLENNGQPLKLKQSFFIDSLGVSVSSLFGTTPGTIYLESVTGIEAGASTGLASIVTALCFVPCLFIAPIVTLIPAYATAPILIFVGILMMGSLSRIKDLTLEDGIPLFFTIVLMPLTSSVTMGVLAGILSTILIQVLVGKYKKVSLPMYLIGGVCLLALLCERF